MVSPYRTDVGTSKVIAVGEDGLYEGEDPMAGSPYRTESGTPKVVLVDSTGEPIPTSLEQVNLEAQGLDSQNFDRQIMHGNEAMVTGREFAVLLPVRAGQVITNIVVHMATVGATLTLVKFGLRDTDFNLLAATADVKADYLASVGNKVNALTSPYTVEATGGVYVVMLAVGTTPPGLGYANTSNFTDAIGSGAAPTLRVDSQTDLEATAALTASAQATSFWAGLN